MKKKQLSKNECIDAYFELKSLISTIREDASKYRNRLKKLIGKSELSCNSLEQSINKGSENLRRKTIEIQDVANALMTMFNQPPFFQKKNGK